MWKQRVKQLYSSLEDLRAYDETYGVCARAGFASPELMWKANPFIQGSVNPADFGTEKTQSRKKIKWVEVELEDNDE